MAIDKEIELEDTCYKHLQDKSLFLNEQTYKKCVDNCNGHNYDCPYYRRIGKRELANRSFDDW